MKVIMPKGLSFLKLNQFSRRFCSEKTPDMTNFERIMQNNKEWAAQHVQN
jgi:hypothetical protein